MSGRTAGTAKVPHAKQRKASAARLTFKEKGGMTADGSGESWQNFQRLSMMTCVKRCSFVDKMAPTGEEEEDEKQQRTEEVGPKNDKRARGSRGCQIGGRS